MSRQPPQSSHPPEPSHSAYPPEPSHPPHAFPDAMDQPLDEVAAAKLALLNLGHEGDRQVQEAAPSLISKHPLLSVGLALAAGALLGGLPVARRLLLGATMLAGKKALTSFLKHQAKP